MNEYEFLEAIYREYHRPFDRFNRDRMERDPLLGRFFHNSKSFRDIDDELRRIAKAAKVSFLSADSFGDLEDLRDSMIGYWNYIKPVYDNWADNDGADGAPGHEQNYMYALYAGTSDCIAILSRLYPMKGYVFELDPFHGISAEILSERLEDFGRGFLPNIPSNMTHVEVRGSHVKSSDSSKKRKETLFRNAVEKYDPLFRTVANALVQGGILKPAGENYTFIKEDWSLFAYIGREIHGHVDEDNSYICWEYFRIRLACSERDYDTINNEIKKMRNNSRFFPCGSRTVDEAIKSFEKSYKRRT